MESDAGNKLNCVQQNCQKLYDEYSNALYMWRFVFIERVDLIVKVRTGALNFKAVWKKKKKLQELEQNAWFIENDKNIIANV